MYITGNASTVNLWTTKDGSSKPSKSVLIASTEDAELAKRYSFLAEEIERQLTGIKCVRCNSSDARYCIDAKDYCVTCHAVETELRAKIAKIEAQRRLIEVLESDVEKAMAERDELQSKNAKLREQLAILIEGGEAADELIMMLKGIVEHTASSNKVTPPGQDAARQILAKINAYHEKYT